MGYKTTLKSITYSKDVVRPGESFEMYIDAEDEDSGIDSMYITLWNPSKNKSLDVYGIGKDENGRWMGRITIPEFAENGEWGYRNILIRDFAEMKGIYSGILINTTLVPLR